ncbi:hypothetical protein [Lysobacter sp. FW306-1B-D06B]|uniref:hypothetical protein n=1 Tax=Lysobacter sp. FW306-1B-D06B TaxID=3140250 RepID=UPI00314015F6
MRRLPKILLAAVLMMSLFAIASCASPQAEPAQAATPQRAAAPQPEPKRVEAPAAAATGEAIKLDFSCKTDSDCAVKNVGNCCGAKPACVNANSPTDPEGVKAECARKGIMAMCGFKPVEGCQCVKGECKDKVAEVESVH